MIVIDRYKDIKPVVRGYDASTIHAVNTLINGNIDDFKVWLLRCSKLDMLDAIDYAKATFSHDIKGRMTKLLRERK